MKIALGQIRVIPGNIDANISRMLDFIEESKLQGADLVILPEMCVGGYFVGDYWRDTEWVRDVIAANQSIYDATRSTANLPPIAVAFGNAYLDERYKGRDGRPAVYNAVYCYRNGKPVSRNNDNVLPQGVTFKTNLPTYRFFDDQRYFLGMQDYFDTQTTKHMFLGYSHFLIEDKDGNNSAVGFELCEDLWCEDYFYKNSILNPTDQLIHMGAEYICNLSASPWTYGKNNARHKRIQSVAKKCKEYNEFGEVVKEQNFKPFFYVNCVGVQNNGKNIITFDGGSTVYDSKAEPAYYNSEPYTESLTIVDAKSLIVTNTKRLPEARHQKSRIAEKYKAIVQGIKGLQSIGGWARPPVIIVGLSGGIDSAVVAALCSHAFGSDNVIAVNMPSKYNSSLTKDAANQTAAALGIEYITIPIGSMVESTLNEISTIVDHIPDIVLENIQAKIRSVDVLSNLAQIKGIERETVGLYTSNGNKNEIFLGYYTLDGDGRGAINPIGDLTKTEVYDMAKYINQIRPNSPIPENMIPGKDYCWDEKIKPTAELKNNQIDPIKFGYHCGLISKVLDYNKTGPAEILQWWLDGTLPEKAEFPEKLMKNYGLIDASIFIEDLRWFFSQLRQSVHKRVQSVPIVLTSKTSFGYDLRESILPPFEWSREAEALVQKALDQGQYKPTQV